jgi:hypothetical protein
MRKLTLLCSVVCTLLSANFLLAVYVPPTAPKALQETQDPSAVSAHEQAALTASKQGGNPVVPADWIEQIRQMAAQNSQRESKPLEKFELVFKKDGSLARLLVAVARNAKRTPNDAQQNHEVSTASYDAKSGKLKLDPKATAEGPDSYELFSIDQLGTVCQELPAVQRLQVAFVKAGLNYALQANVIVAPDGKSWAWEIGPSEEQMPNVIYAMYYYPITRELHSVRLESKKAAAKLEKAATEAGLQLQWFKDMNER